MGEHDYWTEIPHRLHIKICERINRLEDVEDVEQDILLHIWKSRFSFRGDCSFYTWAYRIAENRINDFYRKRYRQERNDTAAGCAWLERKKNQAIYENMTQKIYSEQLLHRLPVKNRYIVKHWSDGDSFGEIAAAIGASYEATRSRWRRAIAKLSNMQ